MPKVLKDDNNMQKATLPVIQYFDLDHRKNKKWTFQFLDLNPKPTWKCIKAGFWKTYCLPVYSSRL